MDFYATYSFTRSDGKSETRKFKDIKGCAPRIDGGTLLFYDGEKIDVADDPGEFHTAHGTAWTAYLTALGDPA